MVEIIVALAILTFGIMGIYEQFLAAGKQGRERLLPAQARLLAHQELEQLRACSYESLKSWKPPLRPVPYSSNLKFLCQDQVTPRPDGMLELTVRMGWDVRNDQKFKEGQSIMVKGLKAP